MAGIGIDGNITRALFFFFHLFGFGIIVCQKYRLYIYMESMNRNYLNASMKYTKIYLNVMQTYGKGNKSKQSCKKCSIERTL